jgi:enamine deaminase RidA (YjgF/YER057c/UK114 family)
VFVAGQIGWAPDGSFPAADLPGQVRIALGNVLAVLAEAGGRPEHIARMTWYVVDRADYLACAAEIGGVYRELMGRVYPAMSAVEVSALMEAEAKVEIEATAVVPAAPGTPGHAA